MEGLGHLSSPFGPRVPLASTIRFEPPFVNTDFSASDSTRHVLQSPPFRKTPPTPSHAVRVDSSRVRQSSATRSAAASRPWSTSTSSTETPRRLPRRAATRPYASWRRSRTSSPLVRLQGLSTASEVLHQTRYGKPQDHQHVRQGRPRQTQHARRPHLRRATDKPPPAGGGNPLLPGDVLHEPHQPPLVGEGHAGVGERPGDEVHQSAAVEGDELCVPSMLERLVDARLLEQLDETLARGSDRASAAGRRAYAAARDSTRRSCVATPGATRRRPRPRDRRHPGSCPSAPTARSPSGAAPCGARRRSSRRQRATGVAGASRAAAPAGAPAPARRCAPSPRSRAGRARPDSCAASRC